MSSQAPFPDYRNDRDLGGTKPNLVFNFQVQVGGALRLPDIFSPTWVIFYGGVNILGTAAGIAFGNTAAAAIAFANAQGAVGLQMNAFTLRFRQVGSLFVAAFGASLPLTLITEG